MSEPRSGPAGTPREREAIASLIDEGRYDEAEGALRLAISSYGTSPEAATLELAHTADELAELLCDSGRVGEAATLSRRSLAIKRDLLPPGDPALAHALHNLAVLCQAMGDDAEARSLWAEADLVLGSPARSDPLT